MRVEINFGGDSEEAVLSADRVEAAIDKIFRTAAETGHELNDVKISTGQAAESDMNARRIAQGIEQIGQEARKTRRELEQLKLAQAGSGGGFGGLLPGGARPRTAALGLLGLLGAAGSGPIGAGAIAGGVGASFLGTAGIGAIGTLVAAFSGLGKAIGGDRQEFEKLDAQSQKFVQTLRSLEPWVKQLQATAREGIFPGVEQGLHEALNPQTAGATEQALKGISGALGDVAVEWGKTLGGPQFRQVLDDLGTHGAGEIRDMGDATSHFATALFTLLHAGAPLADWLAHVTDDGAKFVDQWLAGAAASGKLTTELDHGKDELILVAKFVGALSRAVFGLGADLEPVGNLILGDLTTALDHMAGWLEKNRQEVEQITEGALTALVETLKVLWPLVEGFAKVLQAVATAVGGWDHAFEIVIAGTLASKFLSLSKSIDAASFSAGRLNAGLVSLAKFGALSIGVGLLFKGWQQGGGTGFLEQILGSATAGWVMGGPYGAAALLTADVALNVWKQLVKAPAGGDVSDPKNPDYTYTLGRFNGQGVAVKGAPGDTEVGILLQKLAEGIKLTTADRQILSEYVAANKGGGKFLVFKSIADAEAFYKASNVFDLTKNPNGVASAPAANVGTGNVDASKLNAGRQKMLDFAKAALGKPYLWGGSGPNSFDCSGLVMWAFANGLGVTLPHSTYDQVQMGTQVNPGKAKVGDVVFTQYGEGGKAGPGHEGLIVGFTKDGQPIIEAAPHTGANVRTYQGYGAFTGGAKFTVRDLLGTATSTGGTDPFSTPKPLSGSTASDLLPAALRLAMAKASTTPGLGDDRSTINAAIKWLRANIGEFTGEDQINAYMELAALIGQLKTIAKKATTGRASTASITGARGQVNTLGRLFGTDPFAAATSTTSPQASLDAAQAHLDSIEKILSPQIAAIENELAMPGLSAKTVSALRAQLTQYTKAITAALANVKTAVEAQKQSFENAWKDVGQAVLDAFDQQTANYKTPTEQLIAQLTSDKNKQDLQDALTQAQKDLAAALQGTTEGDTAVLGRLQQIVGQYALADKIDAVQSAILGGVHQEISGSQLVSDLQQALIQNTVVDKDAVAAAQKEVDDAQYAIRMAGLEDQAALERSNYDTERAELRKHLVDLLDDWQTYFRLLKGQIWTIPAEWQQALASMGINDPGTQAAAVTQPGMGIVPAGGSTSSSWSSGSYDVGGTLIQGKIPGFAAGADFVTRGPTPFMAGEGGRPERVTVTPISDGSYGRSLSADGHHFNIKLEGDLAMLGDFIKVKAVESIPEINRSLGVRANRRLRAGRF